MPITVRCQVTRVSDGSRTLDHDMLAAEEPLEIRVQGRPLAVTMRTPGNDFELAAGFLLTEGLVPAAQAIRTISYCTPDREGDQQFNVVDVALAPGVQAPPASAARPFPTTSACGLCGKSSIEEVRVRSGYDVADDPCRVTTAMLSALPAELRRHQRVFDRTGGLHAAGLFGADGALVCLREDVGRHNAFDKVVGWAALAGRLPLRGHVILASGRASFELVQKAVVAGIPVMAAVSAPSSLAVALATETGLTLVGFLRGESMNVYSAAHRVG